MKFTERFNELVTLSEKSQVEIANEIKVSKQCVSDYKSGKSFPSLQTLYLICSCLEVSADYLLGLTDEY
ncbi:MAG: helix-turn-helix transcriptional regulator [Clostridia bacterium]|nr:helix-turn-helix transcriptional regulator [Clostridia bacterium]